MIVDPKQDARHDPSDCGSQRKRGHFEPFVVYCVRGLRFRRYFRKALMSEAGQAEVAKWLGVIEKAEAKLLRDNWYDMVSDCGSLASRTQRRSRVFALLLNCR